MMNLKYDSVIFVEINHPSLHERVIKVSIFTLTFGAALFHIVRFLIIHQFENGLSRIPDLDTVETICERSRPIFAPADDQNRQNDNYYRYI